MPAVARKDVSVIAESWEEAQRLPEAFWHVLLDLPLDSWHLACDGHHEPPHPSRAPLASVEVLVPQSSLQVASKMGCNGHSANSNPFDKSSVVWGLPDQKVQTGIKTPDK